MLRASQDRVPKPTADWQDLEEHLINQGLVLYPVSDGSLPSSLAFSLGCSPEELPSVTIPASASEAEQLTQWSQVLQCPIVVHTIAPCSCSRHESTNASSSTIPSATSCTTSSDNCSDSSGSSSNHRASSTDSQHLHVVMYHKHFISACPVTFDSIHINSVAAECLRRDHKCKSCLKRCPFCRSILSEEDFLSISHIIPDSILQLYFKYRRVQGFHAETGHSLGPKELAFYSICRACEQHINKRCGEYLVKDIFDAILKDAAAAVAVGVNSEMVTAFLISVVARVFLVMDLEGNSRHLQINDLRRFVLFCDKRCPEMLGSMLMALHMPPSVAVHDPKYSYAGGQRLTTEMIPWLEPSSHETGFRGTVWMGDWHILLESGLSADQSLLVTPAVQSKSAVPVAPAYKAALCIPSGHDRQPLPDTLPIGYAELMKVVKAKLLAQQRAGTTLPRQPQNPQPAEDLAGDLVLLRAGDTYIHGQLHLSPANKRSVHSTVGSAPLCVHRLKLTDKAFDPDRHDVVGIGCSIVDDGYDVALRLIAQQGQGKVTLTWPGGGNRRPYAPENLEVLRKLFEDFLQGTWANAPWTVTKASQHMSAYSLNLLCMHMCDWSLTHGLTLTSHGLVVGQLAPSTSNATT